MVLGEIVIIKIGGKEYNTIIDSEGVQRFPTNKLFRHLVDEGMVNLNSLAVAYTRGLFSQEEFMMFCMGLGYSVSGFSDLSFFEELEIENLLWV